MRLVLFFTCGVSLDTWIQSGLFDREKLIYEEHLKRGHIDTVYWLTYGSNDDVIARDLHSRDKLHPNINVIPMPAIFESKIGKILYSFFIPFLQRQYLKAARVYKTNQIYGSWTAVLAKFFFGIPLIVRAGYIPSLLEKKNKDFGL